jgi:hypothetical protein
LKGGPNAGSPSPSGSRDKKLEIHYLQEPLNIN